MPCCSSVPSPKTGIRRESTIDNRTGLDWHEFPIGPVTRLMGLLCETKYSKRGNHVVGFRNRSGISEELDWIEAFVREEVEPLDHVLGFPYDVQNPKRNALVRPLQAQVKKRRLWACHLGPELGGQGYGQVKLGLINEILGRSRFAPTVFGCQAPDSGQRRDSGALRHARAEEALS